MGIRSMVYIGNREIQSVVYKKQRKRTVLVDTFRYPIESGCIVQGRIADEEQFRKTVASFLLACPYRLARAELLFPSGLVSFKRMEAPGNARKKQILYAARMEFPAAEAGKDMVFDYRTAGGVMAGRTKAPRELWCGGLERSVMRQYMRVFRDSGCRLTGMYAPEDCIIRGAWQTADLSRDAVILCVLDGQYAMLFLLAECGCRMHSRARLSGKRGKDEAAGELVGRIRAMNQFYRNQSDLHSVSRVFFIGMEESEWEALRAAEDEYGLPFEICPLELDMDGREDIAYASMPVLLLSVMAAGQKKLDFLAAERKNRVRSVEKREPFLPGMRMVGIVGMILLLVAGGLRYRNTHLEMYRNELQRYTSQEENLRLYHEGKELEEQIRMLVSETEQVKQLEARMKSDEPDGRLMKKIEAVPGAEVMFDYRYSGEDRELSFTCLAADYRQIPDFVDGLEALTEFEDVAYTGYARDGGTEKYQFSITCQLFPEEGGVR